MMHRRISATAGAEVAHLLQSTLQSHPPIVSRPSLATGRGRAQPLGRYLLSFGYITPTQLVMALAEQRQQAVQGVSRFLGDILVDHGMLDLHVGTTMLLIQLLDRLLDPYYATPWRLGEYLVLTNHVTPAQLAPALRVQAWLRQQGMPVYLGELLVQQKIIDQPVLTAALVAQQQKHPNQDMAWQMDV
jgi:hypothetical protein